MRLSRAPCGLMFLAVVGVVLAGCNGDDGTEGPQTGQESRQTVTVTAADAVGADVPVIVRAVGRLRAVERAELTPNVAGIVQEIRFVESTRVEAGDVVARLDAAEARADLRAAQTRRDRIARRVETLQSLADGNAISPDEVDEVRTELDEAEAQVARARQRVDDHDVLARFDGLIGLRRVSPGSHVSPGSAIATLTSVDPIEAVLAVPTRQLAQIEPGQEAAVATDAFPGSIFSGTVTRLDPAADEATQTVPVVVSVPNPTGMLKPGLFVDAEIRTETRRSVLVPESGVTFAGIRVEVYVAGEDGSVERRDVRVGRRVDGVVEILDGLRPGERVVTGDTERLRQVLDGRGDVEIKPDPTLGPLRIEPGRGVVPEEDAGRA